MIKPTVKHIPSNDHVPGPKFNFLEWEPGMTLHNDGQNIDFVSDGKDLYVCAVPELETNRTIAKMKDQGGLLKLVSKGNDGQRGPIGAQGRPGHSPKITAKFDGSQMIFMADGNRIAVTSDLKGPAWKPELEGDKIVWNLTKDDERPEPIDLKQLRAHERPLLLRTNSDNTKRSDETSGPANFIQWKYEGDHDWTNLISISELMNLTLAGVTIWKSRKDNQFHFGHKEVVKAKYEATHTGKQIITDVELGEVLFDAGPIPFPNYELDIEEMKARLCALEAKNFVRTVNGVKPDDNGDVTVQAGLDSVKSLKSGGATEELEGEGVVELKTLDGQSLIGTGDLDLSDYAKKSDIPTDYVKSVKLNGSTKNPNSNGLVDLGSIVTTVNGNAPDANGNISISIGDVDLGDYVKKTDLAKINGNLLYNGGNLSIGGLDDIEFQLTPDNKLQYRTKTGTTFSSWTTITTLSDGTVSPVTDIYTSNGVLYAVVSGETRTLGTFGSGSGSDVTSAVEVKIDDSGNLYVKYSDNSVKTFELPSGSGSGCATCWSEQDIVDIIVRYLSGGDDIPITVKNMLLRIYDNSTKVHVNSEGKLTGNQSIITLVNTNFTITDSSHPKRYSVDASEIVGKDLYINGTSIGTFSVKEYFDDGETIKSLSTRGSLGDLTITANYVNSQIGDLTITAPVGFEIGERFDIHVGIDTASEYRVQDYIYIYGTSDSQFLNLVGEGYGMVKKNRSSNTFIEAVDNKLTFNFKYKDLVGDTESFIFNDLSIFDGVGFELYADATKIAEITDLKAQFEKTENGSNGAVVGTSGNERYITTWKNVNDTMYQPTIQVDLNTSVDEEIRNGVIAESYFIAKIISSETWKNDSEKIDISYSSEVILDDDTKQEIVSQLEDTVRTIANDAATNALSDLQNAQNTLSAQVETAKQQIADAKEALDKTEEEIDAINKESERIAEEASKSTTWIDTNNQAVTTMSQKWDPKNGEWSMDAVKVTTSDMEDIVTGAGINIDATNARLEEWASFTDINLDGTTRARNAKTVADAAAGTIGSYLSESSTSSSGIQTLKSAVSEISVDSIRNQITSSTDNELKTAVQQLTATSAETTVGKYKYLLDESGNYVLDEKGDKVLISDEFGNIEGDIATIKQEVSDNSSDITIATRFANHLAGIELTADTDMSDITISADKITIGTGDSITTVEGKLEAQDAKIASISTEAASVVSAGSNATVTIKPDVFTMASNITQYGHIEFGIKSDGNPYIEFVNNADKTLWTLGSTGFEWNGTVTQQYIEAYPSGRLAPIPSGVINGMLNGFDISNALGGVDQYYMFHVGKLTVSGKTYPLDPYGATETLSESDPCVSGTSIPIDKVLFRGTVRTPVSSQIAGAGYYIEETEWRNYITSEDGTSRNFSATIYEVDQYGKINPIIVRVTAYDNTVTTIMT